MAEQASEAEWDKLTELLWAQMCWEQAEFGGVTFETMSILFGAPVKHSAASTTGRSARCGSNCVSVKRRKPDAADVLDVVRTIALEFRVQADNEHDIRVKYWWSEMGQELDKLAGYGLESWQEVLRERVTAP